MHVEINQPPGTLFISNLQEHMIEYMHQKIL